MHISIRSRNGARGVPKIYFSEILLFTETRKFNIGLNTAKITDYIEKCFKEKLDRITFLTKKLVDAYLYLRSGTRELQRYATFEIL